MIVTIFAGGSGSLELQRGFYHLFKSYITIRVVLNGYDDGKSTGIVRKVYNNNILGPSDLRKNQIFRHELEYGETNLSRFLKTRFNAQSHIHAQTIILNFLDYYLIDSKYYYTLKNDIIQFFAVPASQTQTYTDFNVGNIIYATRFDYQGVEEATKSMARILQIPENYVEFQSYDPLTLTAKTKKGEILRDEASIVNFSQRNDIIESILLYDILGTEAQPFLRQDIKQLIHDSDLIIVSSGTLWSSLIPTFVSQGFYEAILKSDAPKIVVANAQPDSDTLGVTDTEYLQLLERYLPLHQFCIVYADNAIIRPPLTTPHNYTCVPNILQPNNKHNGIMLCLHILQHYFAKQHAATHYIFDYDYTLYDPETTQLNNDIWKEWKRSKLSKSILSRNHINNIDPRYYDDDLYTQFGIWSNADKKYIYPNLQLSVADKRKIYQLLSAWPCDKYDRDISICAKPLKDRHNMASQLNAVLVGLKCVITGKTSIEIVKSDTDKLLGYLRIGDRHLQDNLLYISDEDDITKVPDQKKWIANNNDVYLFLRWSNQLCKSLLPNLIIIAGGNNSRNNGNLKLLEEISDDGVTVLNQTLKMTKHLINNVYIFTTHTHRTILQQHVRGTGVHIVSVGNLTTKGNLHTLSLGLRQTSNCSGQTIIMWSDCVLPNTCLIKELTSMFGKFIIPTEYIFQPYAYTICDKQGNVERVAFQKNEPATHGYHDLSIFSVQIPAIIPYIVTSLQKTENESSLFDIIPKMYRDGAYTTTYESKHKSFSFNSQSELQQLKTKINNLHFTGFYT